jgi:O-antigen/teichoic acid export membrane protein
MAAHLASLALTAALCLPLLARYYDLKLIVRAPLPPRLTGTMLLTGLALLPATLSRRLLIDAPPVALNLMLRQAFQYVMAPLSSAQAHLDRAELGPLYRFAARVSTALVVPLSGLLVFAGADILSVYREEAQAALPLLALLVAARAAEAIVGPATPIVEMAGHRLLPLLNSALGVALGAALAAWLVPEQGALGMAIAVAAATVLIAYAATLELRLSDRLSPFDRKLFQGLAIALAGVALMALAESLTRGPTRFALVLALWAATSWLALRFGLNRPDREALGAIARKLRLA